MPFFVGSWKEQTKASKRWKNGCRQAKNQQRLSQEFRLATMLLVPSQIDVGFVKVINKMHGG